MKFSMPTRPASICAGRLRLTAGIARVPSVTMTIFAWRTILRREVGERVGKFEWTHPPLSKELIAAGIALLGDTSVSRRLPAAVAGAIGVRASLSARLVLDAAARRGVPRGRVAA